MAERRPTVIGAAAMGCAYSSQAQASAAGDPILRAGGPRSGVALLIIDPQNSFHGGGSLAVPGADEVRVVDALFLCRSNFPLLIFRAHPRRTVCPVRRTPCEYRACSTTTRGTSAACT